MEKTEIGIQARFCSREFAFRFENGQSVVQSGVEWVARVARVARQSLKPSRTRLDRQPVVGGAVG
jgi:hypothetical protein